jgi:phenylalanyl-tRNA synthetase beta chain
MPPAPDQSSLRTSLIPGQIEAIAKNLRFYHSFRLFESSEVYAQGQSHPSCPEESLPLQTRVMAGSIVDLDPERAFYEVKGIFEHLPEAVQVQPVSFSHKEQPAWADAAAWLNIENEGKIIGSLGLLSNRAKRLAGIKYADACLFTLNWQELTVLESRSNQFKDLPLYPHVFEDLSLVVSDRYTWADVKAKVEPLVESLTFVDEYRGSQIPEGSRSLTFRVELGAEDRTLTGAEVNQKRQEILGLLEKELGAGLRQN